MKLQTSATPLEVSGGGAQSSFSIAMNAKAFRVLSDNMYQNKIGSIVRELSCNAYDSHVMANKVNVPFTIHIPDSFEPWFSVQDYGIGLSPQAIVEVFTKYFESTKDDNNNVVGAFGLGSKTPFAYTDQFTVTSIHNGVKRTYSACIAENGLPTMILMAEMDTTECNGVEIKMSAKREDYNTFANEVASQLRFFPVKPKILNRSGFVFNPVSVNLVIATPNVAISNDAPGYNQPWAHIIQGNVGYPLDVNQVMSKVSPPNANLLRYINGHQTRFLFDIGEIGVTASREGIEYNAHTIGNIEKKLTAVRAEISKFVTDKLASLKTDWEKAEYINSNPAVNKFANASSITIKNLTPNSNGHYSFSIEKLLISKTKKNAYGNAETIGKLRVWSHGRTTREDAQSSFTPKSGNSFTIALRDTANRPNIKARFLLDKMPQNSKLYEIEMFDDADYTDALIVDLKDSLGGFDKIVRLSSVVLPVVSIADKNGKLRSAYTRPTYYAMGNANNSNIRQWDKEIEKLDEMDDEMVYVVIRDMATINVTDDDFISNYVNLRQFGDNVAPLIAIREGDLKKIDGMANYRKLGEYVTEHMEKLKKNKKLRVKWRHAMIASYIFGMINAYLRDETFQKLLATHAPKSKLHKLYKISKKYTVKSEDEIYKMARFMGWSDSDNEKIKDYISKIYSEMFVKHPFLHAFTNWSMNRNIPPEHAAKYLAVM